MKRGNMLCCLVTFFTFLSCEQIAIKEPTNNPVANFELFWQEFDRYYSFFEQKNIDWDSVYAVYRPQVNPNTPSTNLFSIFSDMTLPLQDAHVSIYSFSQYSGYDQKEGFPADAPDYANVDISEVKNPSSKISYATIGDLGYIRITSFSGELAQFSVIDEALETLRDKAGIIIDVRGNGGGNSDYARRIASRFADRERKYNYFRLRNGPEHDDFTDWGSSFIFPSGSFQYTRPVALLINRGCFSACEDFVMMMRTLPHVTLIGGRTGGGTGRPLYRELPNGWTYRLSSGMVADPVTQEIIIDSLGTTPDIEVHITSEDSAARRDTILERAILELGQ